MKRLHGGLSSLPKERKGEIEEDLRQHFEAGEADGIEEDILVEKLGDPILLAKEYTELYEAEHRPKEKSTAKKIWSGVGMFFFNLVFMLPVWLTAFCLWLVPACGFVVILACVIMFLAVIITTIVPVNFLIIDYPWVAFFGSISGISLGVLMSVFAVWSGKKLLVLFQRYVSWNARVITGRRKTQ